MKVESEIVRMMAGYARTISQDVDRLKSHPDPRLRLVALLGCTRALAKVMEAELINHPGTTT